MLKIVITDIDGVLTEGSVLVDAKGNEQKTIHFHDTDAAFLMRSQGLLFAMVTAEDKPVTLVFRDYFQPDFFFNNAKRKGEAVSRLLQEQGISPDEALYLGDGMLDLPAFRSVKYTFCPADSISDIKALASHQGSLPGGHGCLWEAWEWILQEKLFIPRR
jgi:3-deoxy-D-manno-octulosonate 8-phosphate phosphatase (KDO 8-P phosphatase)